MSPRKLSADHSGIDPEVITELGTSWASTRPPVVRALMVEFPLACSIRHNGLPMVVVGYQEYGETDAPEDAKARLICTPPGGDYDEDTNEGVTFVEPGEATLVWAHRDARRVSKGLTP